MASFISKSLRYYFIFQLWVLVVCLYLPKISGLLYNNYLFILLIIGLIFFTLAIVINILILITIGILSITKKENLFNLNILKLLTASFFVSIMFSPYLQLSESDTTENQVKRMYDRAINKQLICKTYDELINLFGYPENIIQQTISKNGQSFNEQQLRYYPLVFLLEEYVSVTIVSFLVK